jgi:hypothetical protein
MYKLTALLAVLVLGSSASAAMASSRSYAGRPGAERTRVDRSDRTRITREPVRFVRPDPAYDRRAYDIDRSWNRGTMDDFGPRRYRPTWVALSAPLQLTHTGEDCIDVTDGGTFTQLRLQAAGGVAAIDRVIVRFADGSDQVADLDRVLSARDGMLEIPLDGNNRRIDQIIVTGAPGARGAFQVFAI